MVERQLVAPNGRTHHIGEFMSGVQSRAVSSSFPKSKEEPTIKVWAQRSTGNSDNWGSGRVL
jgi:hypothetical protein